MNAAPTLAGGPRRTGECCEGRGHVGCQARGAEGGWGDGAARQGALSSLVRKCTAARLGAEQKCDLLSNGPRRAPRGYTRGKGVQWASERAETSTTGNRSEKTGGCLCGLRFL